jgi:transcriptional regulator with XRE-family HTH domain
MDERTLQPDGVKVRQLRRERGWTQQDLVEASGVKIGTIRNSEADKRVFPQNLLAVAEALEVDLQIC